MIKLTVDQPIDAILKLKARKTMRGDIVVLDHPEIDVVVSPHENRVAKLIKTTFSGCLIFWLERALF